MMRKYAAKPTNENRFYQRQVAVSLVDELGRDSAVSFCLDQGWDGTLKIILDTQNRAG